MKKTILGAALLVSCLASAAQAQQYPHQPIYSTPTPAAAPGDFTHKISQVAASLRSYSIVQVPGPVPGRPLRHGDRGHDVTWLANAMALRGYHLPLQQLELQDFHGPGAAHPSSAQSYQGLWEGEMAFDDNLQALLAQYQFDNGLGADGIAGSRVVQSLTRNDAAIAAGLDEWASAIEGWRQQALAAGHSKFIVVNLPSYTLHAFNSYTGEQVMESRVVVGAAGSRTPRFATNIVNLKFNPDWTPTASMRGKRPAPPGPRNPLGRVRFSTDNNMHIYLHDTNSPSLFSRSERAMSMGCVRVQQWAALASWVADRDEQWVDEMTPVDSYRTRYIKITPVPVVMAYSLVDLTEGHATMHGDVYGMGSRAIGYSSLAGGSSWAVDLPVIAR